MASEPDMRARRAGGLARPAAWIAIIVVVAIGVTIAIVSTGGGEEVVVAAGEPGERFPDVREGERLRVEGIVREADYSPETGDADGIAFETENVIFATSVRPAPDAETEGADLDLDGPDLRGERVTVVGEVAEIADDGGSFVLELD